MYSESKAKVGVPGFYFVPLLDFDLWGGFPTDSYFLRSEDDQSLHRETAVISPLKRIVTFIKSPKWQAGSVEQMGADGSSPAQYSCDGKPTDLWESIPTDSPALPNENYDSITIEQ